MFRGARSLDRIRWRPADGILYLRPELGKVAGVGPRKMTDFGQAWSEQAPLLLMNDDLSALCYLCLLPVCLPRAKSNGCKMGVENEIFFQWIFFEGFAEKSSSFFPFFFLLPL